MAGPVLALIFLVIVYVLYIFDAAYRHIRPDKIDRLSNGFPRCRKSCRCLNRCGRSYN